jgi:hypothetical protein
MTQNRLRLPREWRNGGGALGWAVVAFVLMAMRLGAQQPSPLLSGFNPIGDSRNGFQLYDVTGFAGWESVVNPQQGGLFALAGSSLKSDELVGAGASAGWSRHGKKTSVEIMYSLNYIGQIRYNNLSALSHFLALNASRQLGTKWRVGLSGSAALSTYDQLLFSPTVFGRLAAVPATFDDLAGAVLAGSFTNNQLASLLTGAPLIESPARTLLFGDRVFFSSASSSLSYAHSRRWSITMSAHASLTKHVNDGRQQDHPQNLYLLPRAEEVGASLAISYALTPRTQIGVDANSSRGFSSLQQSYATIASAFLGREMTQHWMLQLHAGGGFTTRLGGRHSNQPRPTPIVGGSLGYKTRANTFLGAYDRTLSQSYGVGASDASTISAAWQWWRPGNRWGLSSNYMRDQFHHGPFGSLNGWRSAIALTRRMGDHMVFETAYTYASYATNAVDFPYATNAVVIPYNAAQHAVRVSVMWTPQNQEGH